MNRPTPLQLSWSRQILQRISEAADLLSRKEKSSLACIFVLTFIAGLLNGGTVALWAMPVSHATGNITQLGLALIKGQWSAVGTLLLCLLVFFLGAFGSGLLRRRWQQFGLFRRVCVFFLPGLGSLLASVFYRCLFLVLILMSLLLGYQNALPLTFRRITVRSTHLTGYFTDAGLAFSSFIGRSKTPESRRARHDFYFYLFSVILFFLGVITATWLSTSSGCLFVPYFIAACGYFSLAISAVKANQ